MLKSSLNANAPQFAYWALKMLWFKPVSHVSTICKADGYLILDRGPERLSNLSSCTWQIPQADSSKLVANANPPTDKALSLEEVKVTVARLKSGKVLETWKCWKLEARSWLLSCIPSWLAFGSLVAFSSVANANLQSLCWICKYLNSQDSCLVSWQGLLVHWLASALRQKVLWCVEEGCPASFMWIQAWCRCASLHHHFSTCVWTGY